MIRLHLYQSGTPTVPGGTIYLNPQHIEMVYAAAATPNAGTIKMATDSPDYVVFETADQVVNMIRALIT